MIISYSVDIQRMHLEHYANHDHDECEDLLDILTIEIVDCEKI